MPDKAAEEQNDLYHFERQGTGSANREQTIIPNEWKTNNSEEYNELMNKEVVDILGNIIVVK